MNMEQIFAKSIRRPIEGVIKADDESQLENELNEYVLTSEAADRLTGFFEDYNQNRSNGAWLSGFFGSGKSHLLKMLAVVLENRVVNGHAALDLFLPKCADNPMLKGLLARACQSPSRSILFNIDQKADVINKTETDAVLSVFLKVFNGDAVAQGYFPSRAGKKGVVAAIRVETPLAAAHGIDVKDKSILDEVVRIAQIFTDFISV